MPIKDLSSGGLVQRIKAAERLVAKLQKERRVRSDLRDAAAAGDIQRLRDGLKAAGACGLSGATDALLKSCEELRATLQASKEAEEKLGLITKSLSAAIEGSDMSAIRRILSETNPADLEAVHGSAGEGEGVGSAAKARATAVIEDAKAMVAAHEELLDVLLVAEAFDKNPADKDPSTVIGKMALALSSAEEAGLGLDSEHVATLTRLHGRFVVRRDMLAGLTNCVKPGMASDLVTMIGTFKEANMTLDDLANMIGELAQSEKREEKAAAQAQENGGGMGGRGRGREEEDGGRKASRARGRRRSRSPAGKKDSATEIGGFYDGAGGGVATVPEIEDAYLQFKQFVGMSGGGNAGGAAGSGGAEAKRRPFGHCPDPLAAPLTDLDDPALSKNAVDASRLLNEWTGAERGRGLRELRQLLQLGWEDSTSFLRDEIYIQILSHLYENFDGRSVVRGWRTLDMALQHFLPSERKGLRKKVADFCVLHIEIEGQASDELADLARQCVASYDELAESAEAAANATGSGWGVSGDASRSEDVLSLEEIEEQMEDDEGMASRYHKECLHGMKRRFVTLDRSVAVLSQLQLEAELSEEVRGAMAMRTEDGLELAWGGLKELQRKRMAAVTAKEKGVLGGVENLSKGLGGWFS